MGENSSEHADGRQETGTAIYSFMDLVAGEAEQYAADHTSPLSPLLEEIERYSLKKTDSPSWLTGRIEGRFLQLIITLSGFRNVVDIGTFTGYSALAMAESIPEDGKGKAEIEVFNVTKRIAAAKINRSSVKNPIVPEDIVANLIWDSQTSNRFVVVGDFDFDRDVERSRHRTAVKLIDPKQHMAYIYWNLHTESELWGEKVCKTNALKQGDVCIAR